MSKFFRSHHQLKARVCEAQGHTWEYNEPWRYSSPLQGMIRRICSCCKADEWGEWIYKKKDGWIFIVKEKRR